MWGQYQRQDDQNSGQTGAVNYESSSAVDVPTTTNNNSQDFSFSLSDFGFEAAHFDNVLDESYPKRQRVGSMNMLNNNLTAISAQSENDPSSAEDNKGWQSEEDLQKRMAMTHRIMRLLQERKKDPCQKWLQELPHKALRLEKHLYKAAPTLETYMDENTLKSRLRKVANAVVSHVRLEKANRRQRDIVSTLPPNWNTSNEQQQHNIDPPLSQVTAPSTVDNVTVTVPNNAMNQTQLLNQMLEMQKTLNNLMEISSLNGGNSPNEQHQLQQQMLEMQKELTQLSQQTAVPTFLPSIDATLSSNPAEMNQSVETMNISHSLNSTPASNDLQETFGEFLQETFGPKNVAV